jgi:uncharacterized Zn finger protein (UPF0148 family)
MKCDLCGYEYDKSDLLCHAGCPLAERCAVICCPNCGYQVVDESKSKSVRAVRKIQETLVQWTVSSEKKIS